MMNRLVSTILACLISVTVFAEDVDRTVDASPDGRVDVSNISGSVKVAGWTKNSVRVTGTLGRNVEELIVERDGDKVLIKVKVPKRGGRGIDSDLRISVPQNSSIDIGTVSADIDVVDVTGEQGLHTVSGDVNAEHTGADIAAESVSGDVEVRGNHADGEVSASSVSGDVRLIRLAGSVEVEAVSGDVAVEDGSFERAVLETVTGELFFKGTLRNGGKLAIDTVNGDVDVEFSGDVSAKFDIETFNGNINNCFGPKAAKASKYGPGWELEFTEGGGNGRVSISTLNGDVDICD
jgi:putative adhesin